MTAMMLTAFDATSGTVLDITTMTLEQRDQVHGRRTARRNGYDMVCKQCEWPVHLVHNDHQTEFWRHNPDGAKGCIMAEISGGESPEHIEAKIAIARSLRDLTGWTAVFEKRFDADGDLAIVDVYAEHAQPSPHQVPVAWEVQLGHQTHGTFTERTERIRRCAGIHTNWITPHDRELDLHPGIVTNPTADLVVARIYQAPDEDAPPLPPMPLPEFVKGVAARHPRLLWSASGENGRFIAFPRDSVGNIPARPTRPSVPATVDVSDRACDRTPVQRPTFRPEFTRGMLGDQCDICGLSITGIERAWQLGLRLRPCNRCPEEIRYAHTQVWLLA